MTRKWLFFLVVLATVVTLDLVTKSWALHHLSPGGPTVSGIGGIPLTLHFNTGGLWGIGSGTLSRWFFGLATALALYVLAQIYRSTHRSQRFRLFAVPMIAGGAIGNLVDRLRWERGVVDFLGPFDLGFMQWPIFNVADMAISCCTILLVISMWRDGEEMPLAENSAPESSLSEGANETPATKSP
ncbi:MAG: signal peptidase II [Deltaproteobacteria bacterium]|nr:signal peptidase II [Deltaproteobacteria bacterium]